MLKLKDIPDARVGSYLMARTQCKNLLERIACETEGVHVYCDASANEDIFHCFSDLDNEHLIPLTNVLLD